MKLIDEKEVDKRAISDAYFGKKASSDFKLGFMLGSRWTQQKLTPLMIEFAEYIGKFYTLSNYNEWCSLGMPTINTTQQLLEQFLKSRS